MLPQKFHIIPEVQEFSTSLTKPLLFWKKIQKNQEKELHLILLIEGRTSKETHELGKHLWETISAYENELTINQNALSNPEHVCEAILKISNEFLVKWSRGVQIGNWNELGIVIAVSSPSAIYFTRIGKPRLLLYRNNQIVLADENLAQPRSPQFSPPFSELAGGSLMPKDRLLMLSGGLTESFSWDEVSSLITSPETTQAYLNIIRSLEVLSIPQNAAFLLGDLVPINKNDHAIHSITNERIKETRIGELYFQEFNPIARVTNPVTSTATTMVPWKEILQAGGAKTKDLGGLVINIIVVPIRPLAKSFSALSSARKTILTSFFILLIAFVVFLTRSMLNHNDQAPAPQVDYKAMYDTAAKLKDDAQSALIYQDEEKARKNLAEADSLLEQASLSSDWGIKAIKLRQEVDDQLATLDKAQTTEISKVWSNADSQNPIRKLGLGNNGNLLILTGKSAFNLKPGGDNPQAESFSGNLNIAQEKGWLIPSRNEFIFTSPQNKDLYAIDPAGKTVSGKKDLPQEASSSLTAMASYDTFVYFFDPEAVQIKQFVYTNNNLNFKADWLKQDLKSDLKGDPIVSMAIEGNIFAVTQNGNFLRLSGGKKIPWDVEKPGAPIKGDNLVIFTRGDDKNVYLLDPTNKRIVIVEKETGKLKGQVQNSSLSQAVDFQVDEKNKTAYFVTGNDLFKMSFNP